MPDSQGEPDGSPFCIRVYWRLIHLSGIFPGHEIESMSDMTRLCQAVADRYAIERELGAGSAF